MFGTRHILPGPVERGAAGGKLVETCQQTGKQHALGSLRPSHMTQQALKTDLHNWLIDSFCLVGTAHLMKQAKDPRGYYGSLERTVEGLSCLV